MKSRAYKTATQYSPVAAAPPRKGYAEAAQAAVAMETAAAPPSPQMPEVSLKEVPQREVPAPSAVLKEASSLRSQLLARNWPREGSLSIPVQLAESARLTAKQVPFVILFLGIMLQTAVASNVTQPVRIQNTTVLNASVAFTNYYLSELVPQRVPPTGPDEAVPFPFDFEHDYMHLNREDAFVDPAVIETEHEFPNQNIQQIHNDRLIVTHSIIPETIYDHKTFLYDFTKFLPLEGEIRQGLSRLVSFYSSPVRVTIKSEMTALACHESCFEDDTRVLSDKNKADRILKNSTNFWLRPSRVDSHFLNNCPGTMPGRSAHFILQATAGADINQCELLHLSNESTAHYEPTCISRDALLVNVTRNISHLRRQEDCSLECLTDQTCNTFTWMYTKQGGKVCQLGTNFFNQKELDDSVSVATTYTDMCDQCRMKGALAFKMNEADFSVKGRCMASHEDNQLATCVCETTSPDQESIMSMAIINDMRGTLSQNNIEGDFESTTASSSLIPVVDLGAEKSASRHKRGAGAIIAAALRSVIAAISRGGRISYSAATAFVRGGRLAKFTGGAGRLNRLMPTLRSVAARPGMKAFISKTRHFTDKNLWPLLWIVTAAEMGILAGELDTLLNRPPSAHLGPSPGDVHDIMPLTSPEAVDIELIRDDPTVTSMMINPRYKRTSYPPIESYNSARLLLGRLTGLVNTVGKAHELKRNILRGAILQPNVHAELSAPLPNNSQAIAVDGGLFVTQNILSPTKDSRPVQFHAALLAPGSERELFHDTQFTATTDFAGKKVSASQEVYTECLQQLITNETGTSCSGPLRPLNTISTLDISPSYRLVRFYQRAPWTFNVICEPSKFYKHTNAPELVIFILHKQCEIIDHQGHSLIRNDTDSVGTWPNLPGRLLYHLIWQADLSPHMDVWRILIILAVCMTGVLLLGFIVVTSSTIRCVKFCSIRRTATVHTEDSQGRRRETANEEATLSTFFHSSPRFKLKHSTGGWLKHVSTGNLANTSRTDDSEAPEALLESKV